MGRELVNHVRSARAREETILGVSEEGPALIWVSEKPVKGHCQAPSVAVGCGFPENRSWTEPPPMIEQDRQLWRNWSFWLLSLPVLSHCLESPGRGQGLTDMCVPTVQSRARTSDAGGGTGARWVKVWPLT